jgi:hypothetical protein
MSEGCKYPARERSGKQPNFFVDRLPQNAGVKLQNRRGCGWQVNPWPPRESWDWRSATGDRPPPGAPTLTRFSASWKQRRRLVGGSAFAAGAG